mmetsp:Transcript_19019/g.51703  ORF Transcript_19019/g.51703 Transcript_19019/m.51703 type:complete len:318 (+) Transcript_19019:672-1625(+)
MSCSLIVDLAMGAMWLTLMIFSSTLNLMTSMQLRSWKSYFLSENFSRNSANLTLPSPETMESTPKMRSPLSSSHLSTFLPVFGSDQAPKELPQRGGVISNEPWNMIIGHCAMKDSSTKSCVGGGVPGVFADRPYMRRAPICMSYGTTPKVFCDVSVSCVTVLQGWGVAYSQLDRTFLACLAFKELTVSVAWKIFFQGSGVGVDRGSFKVTGAEVLCPAWLIALLTLAQYSSEMVSLGSGARMPGARKDNSPSWAKRLLASALPLRLPRRSPSCTLSCSGTTSTRSPVAAARCPAATSTRMRRLAPPSMALGGGSPQS